MIPLGLPLGSHYVTPNVFFRSLCRGDGCGDVERNWIGRSVSVISVRSCVTIGLPYDYLKGRHEDAE